LAGLIASEIVAYWRQCTEVSPDDSGIVSHWTETQRA